MWQRKSWGKKNLIGGSAGSFSEDRPLGWDPVAAKAAIGRAMEWPAAEATAASGGNREPMLGQRPAECKARSRAAAYAGSRNPYFVSEEKAAGASGHRLYFLLLKSGKCAIL